MNGSQTSFTGDRQAEIDTVVARAAAAARAFRALDQEAVDRIVLAMIKAGLQAATELALLAVEETHFGVVEDKVIKNFVATEFLYDYLKDKKSVGVIDHDDERDIDFFAEPVGVVMAITPITNPTSTVLFKAIVAAKTRNAVLFRPSPHAVRSAQRTVAILAAAAEAAGMPSGALQVIPDAAHEVTHYLLGHPSIDFVWTTGGPKIVQLANRSGKPGISVGPGNAPIYIHRTADIKGAVVDVLISKTFDASVICPAEQTVIIDEAIYEEVVAEFEHMGGHVLSEEDAGRLADFAFGCGEKVKLAALGQPAPELAKRAGITVEPHTKVLLAPLPTDLDALRAHPLVQEKLMPVLGVVRSPSVEHGVAAAVLVTERGGLGHTSAIYANDHEVIDAYAKEVRTGRILVNAPTAVGALGGIYNAMTPTLSLGCGTWGGSSTTDNVNYMNLLNIKQVSRRRTPPQWFRVPTATFFNVGALQALRELPSHTTVVVTDSWTEERGVLADVRRHLTAPNVRVFAEVVPEPGEDVVARGVELLRRSEPDLIVAVGGGSVIDAAKAMRLFYEHPKLTMDELSLPFLDPRKRVVQFPQDSHRTRLVGVPTTAGTGSEATPAAVLTVEGHKSTLVDYTLTPDVAIIDPRLMTSMPPAMTADTGIDALTHALEALVSVFASPYSDAFAMQSARLIFQWLPKAYADGSDVVARTGMADAANIAGQAFANAFVGVNHALAHSVGAWSHLAHGRANAIFLPHVLRYNAALPMKFMPGPGTSSYVAPDKYAQLGRVLFGGHGPEDSRTRLFRAVDNLLDELQLPRTLKEAGICEDEYLLALPDLALTAFADSSMRTNPRMPLIEELTDLLRAGYYGCLKPSSSPMPPSSRDHSATHRSSRSSR